MPNLITSREIAAPMARTFTPAFEGAQARNERGLAATIIERRQMRRSRRLNRAI